MGTVRPLLADHRLVALCFQGKWKSGAKMIEGVGNLIQERAIAAQDVTIMQASEMSGPSGRA